MFSIVGIVVVFGAVTGGFLMEKGKMPVLVQPAELLVAGKRATAGTMAGRGKLGQEIGKLPNRVTMEGHTDSRPYVGQAGYTNSADRANASRRWMQQHGLRIDQVTQVRGFADQSLRDPAHPEDAANRRVTLIIQYQAPDPPAAPQGQKTGTVPAAHSSAPAAKPSPAPAPPAKRA